MGRIRAIRSVAWIALIAASGAAARGEDIADRTQRVEVRVGMTDGDFRGDDGRILQAAVNYVGTLGGGTVRVAPGRYLMRDTLVLSDNVHLVGTPGKTVLVKCDAHQTPLDSTATINEREITVADPSGFRIGDGIMVQDDQSMYGFGVTQATIIGRRGENTLLISRPLYHDYSVSRNARATSAFPVVGLWSVRDATIEGLTIEGNRENNHYLTGCRGGGIFLFECRDVVIRNCTVRSYNGDAISFQTTQRVLIEDCVCENNVGVGLHPGCGTEHAVVRRTRATGNDGDGLFLCVRVKHGLFEDNDFSRNRRHGISIGLKDSDNVFRNNTVAGNSQNGVWFRHEPASGGGHRNVFEKNRILDNGASIVIEGQHHDLVFQQNQIGRTNSDGPTPQAIVGAESAEGLQTKDNEFLNVKAP